MRLSCTAALQATSSLTHARRAGPPRAHASSSVHHRPSGTTSAKARLPAPGWPRPPSCPRTLHPPRPPRLCASPHGPAPLGPPPPPYPPHPTPPAGICPYEQVVCLVVDECHRATGKADIVSAIQRMRQARVRFRVLGLSATPGSTAQQVQVRSAAPRRRGAQPGPLRRPWGHLVPLGRSRGYRRARLGRPALSSTRTQPPAPVRARLPAHPLDHRRCFPT